MTRLLRGPIYEDVLPSYLCRQELSSRIPEGVRDLLFLVSPKLTSLCENFGDEPLPMVAARVR